MAYTCCRRFHDEGALCIVNPGLQQTWICKTTKERVMLSHDEERLQFDMT